MDTKTILVVGGVAVVGFFLFNMMQSNQQQASMSPFAAPGAQLPQGAVNQTASDVEQWLGTLFRTAARGAEAYASIRQSVDRGSTPQPQPQART